MHCRVGANTKQPLSHSMLYFWYWKVVIMFTTFHCQKNNWDLVPKLNAKKSWSSEPCRIFTVKANIGHIVCFVLVNTYSWVPNRSYPPLINFLIFFPPKKFLFQPPPPINYWGKFPTQTNFLKQYTYADLFCDLLKGTGRLYCVLFFKLVFYSIVSIVLFSKLSFVF